METRKDNTFQSKAGCSLRSSWSVLEHQTGPSSAGRRVCFCLIDDPKEGSVWTWAKLMSQGHGKPPKDNSLLLLQNIAHYSFLSLFSMQTMGEWMHFGPSRSWDYFNPFALYNRKASPWNCWSQQIFSICTGFRGTTRSAAAAELSVAFGYMATWDSGNRSVEGRTLPGAAGVVPAGNYKQ